MREGREEGGKGRGVREGSGGVNKGWSLHTPPHHMVSMNSFSTVQHRL